MKILHLIDSLNPGGAERMAVAYANALSQRGEETLLWSTREEGILKETLHPQVQYRFLNRKGPVGLKALFAASSQIKKENIRLIHAHATSFFFATLLKWLNPQLKLIWHDHYGKSDALHLRKTRELKFCSNYFDAVISVNEKLKNWANKELKCKQVYFIKNFVSPDIHPKNNLVLKGNDGKRIVCLANIRPQKNHLNLLKAFQILHQSQPEWSLHLPGNAPEAVWFSTLQDFVKQHHLEQSVFFYGAQKGVAYLLQQAEIGVLSSDSEGLPLALLEYALAGLPVVTTDVGYCREVVQDFGKVVPPQNPEALATALLEYIEQPGQRKTDARLLQKQVVKNYTEAAVLPEVLDIYRELLGINE